MISPTELGDRDLVVLIPNKLVGEVGEPLPDAVQRIINKLATIGYWPVDFGEDNGQGTELWFVHDSEIAKAQAEYFIQKQGQV